jgi:putative flavoprotein involved in K+ transport
MKSELDIDVLVVGAGQSGLSIGYYLKQTDFTFLLVDAVDRIGSSWRNRYDSLVLFSPNAYSALPGLSLRGHPEDFPGKEDIASYLEGYANNFSIPVSLQTCVNTIRKEHDRYIAHTSDGLIRAKNVVVATGAFRKPFVPPLSGKISDDIFQLHSSEYKRPSQLPEGSVLIAGGGNSGAQIAAELSEKKEVFLSCGHQLLFVPIRIMGRSLFWWYDKLGILKIKADSFLAKFLQHREQVIGTELKRLIRSGKVKLKKKLVAIDGKMAEFKDKSRMHVSSIIWATGFQPDFGWIKVDNLMDDQGHPIHRRGVCLVPGIYFLGLPWLSGRRSAQLGGVGFDAKFICDQLIKQNTRQTMRF